MIHLRLLGTSDFDAASALVKRVCLCVRVLRLVLLDVDEAIGAVSYLVSTGSACTVMEMVERCAFSPNYPAGNFRTSSVTAPSTACRPRFHKALLSWNREDRRPILCNLQDAGVYSSYPLCLSCSRSALSASLQRTTSYRMTAQ